MTLKRLFLLFATLAVVAGLATCGMTGIGGEATGSIRVNLASGIARSILPPAGSMDIEDYSLTGVGPEGSSFGPVIATGESATVDSLKPGAWVVTAVARNSSAEPLGSGSGNATVTIGSTSACAILVLEATSPNGTYALSVEWTAEVTNPTVTGTIKDAAGVGAEGNQIFGNPNASPAVSVTSLAPGWYTNIVQLRSSAVLVGGFAEAVRVAAGRQTAATVSLQRTGLIEINITPDFADPLDLTGTPALGTPVNVETGGTYIFDIAASLNSVPTAAVFFWYLNGTFLTTASSLDFDEALIPIGDTARLDVVAFSSADAGRHAGSGTWNVSRVATVIETQTITGTLDMSNWLAQGWTYGELDSGAYVQYVDPVALVNLGGGPVSATGEYTISIAVPGSYLLRVYVWPDSGWQAYPGVAFAYWSESGNVATPAEATVVVMPHDGKPASVVHDFGQLTP